MACEKYTRCEYCENDFHCQLDHMGDGSPWCGKFRCIVENCNKCECISFDEELHEMKKF